ncbi:MAG TPA: hypothetical protein VER96_28670 [Polyangiaceae bacterium]|nr:hypothetical protein [Polyangiaceae bacterium]
MRTLLRSKPVKGLAGVCLIGGLSCLKGCALSFEDYPLGDLCAASDDAGFEASTAPDPALRGCAGMAAKEDSNRDPAGAGGVDGAE